MKKIAIVLFGLMCLQVNAQTTTFNINRNLSCTDIVRPFYGNTRSYGISIDGEGQLFSDTAFIRVVLVDNKDHEWLVYERNSLYATEENTQFQGAAFETSALYDIAPKHLIVTLCDASLYLANVKSNRTAKDRNTVAVMADSVFISKNLQIVERINTKLSTHKKAWRADTTFLSNLRYQERKALFGNDLPNLQGWDYYKYGYYSPLNDNTPQASDNIVKEFDWRTRHGSQNTGSYYYNSKGSGWIPRWRYGQVAAECWAFTVQYTIEAMINLYFNRQLNEKLSVQDILSCSQSGTWNGGGHTDWALDYVANEGIVDDNCFPFYAQQTIPCSSSLKCENPTEKVSIAGRSDYLLGEDTIKYNLITKGVLAAVVKKWGHAMSLVGFGVVKAGDPILYGNFNAGTDQDFVVDEDSPDIGKPYYIFKQSYATYGYDESHFCNIIIDANHNSHEFSHPYEYLNYYLRAFSISTPITSLLYNDSDIDCADNDGDGYYNWGIGPKPATCPNCPDEEDSDDSSPLIGPYNEKYESVVLCDNYVYSPIPESITGNVVWGSEKYLDHDVVVENGGVLTVKNTMYMGESTKIIVKPGGKLILDYRAVLTGLCGNMWSGIEVWGNSTADQYPDENGHYAQGYVEMKNGAVIENAVCALELWRPNHWSTTGGIVHANNATFRNCAMAVHALLYPNPYRANGKTTFYNSRFRNCTFIIDENYLGTSTFFKHIDMDEVNGINFTACHFRADRSVEGVSPYCAGIAAYQSGFSATAYCDYGNGNMAINPCPDEYIKGCSFAGFHRGIHVSNSGDAARTFTVRNASFRDNDCGIYALNTGFATVLSSDFAVGGAPDCSFGILADNVTGFCIEENSFHPAQPNAGQTFGIAIRDSHGSNDIYRNHFDGLTCGNVASGTNSTAPANTAQKRRNTGLTYTCNTNSNNQIDFCVPDEGSGPTGIQQQQGSATLPAGNTFSGSQWHFHNSGDLSLIYHYYVNSNEQTPNEGLLHRVTLNSTNNANPCHPHYGNQGPLRSGSQKAEIEEGFLAAQAAHDGLCRILDSRIDGGSTAAETADINTAAPSDLWRLRAKLLGHSPYLSQDVLIAAADRHNVFPESVLFEILAANPDELKKDTLIRYMEQKAHPMPQYMTDLLRQMASGVTARTALLAQMGHYAHERDLAAGDIVRSNLNDTLADHAELRAWLGNMESLAADRMAVASFVQQRDFGSALALAASLPELYGLQGDELNDHNDYISLLSLYQTLDGEGRNAHQLTEAETAMVEGIANDGQGTSRAMAEALLQSRSDGRVPASYCPTMPEANGGRGSTASPDPTLLNKALGFSASLTPNPANTWAAIDYTLPAGATKATLVLTNTLGVAVMTAELNGNQGQKVLDLRPLAAGVYGYAVRCGEYVQNGKIVITK